jgi:cytochrome P450
VRGVASWPWWLEFIQNPLECFAAAQTRFGPLCVLGNPLPFWTKGRRFVFAIGGDYTRQVLGQPDVFRSGGQVMPGPRGSAHYRIRHGILAMYGRQHHDHRRSMRPPFLKPAVASYTAIMAQLIDQIIDRWRSDETLDVYLEMRALTNWVAAYILFGNEDFSASIQIGNAIEDWLTLDARAKKIPVWLDVPGTPYRQMLRQAERVETLVRQTIEHNRHNKSQRGDVISVLISALDANEVEMSEIDLIAHAVILYAASFETTASALAWTLFLISQHPSIASDLHDEINSHIKNWPPDYRDLDTLPLLDGIVLEALRLMPPVSYTYRTARHDVELGEILLHDGDKVIVNHYHTHRDPNIFQNPTQFDPTRWFGARPAPYEFTPFSAGPRLCLGYSFALLELKLTVARVMQRFRLTVVPGSVIDGVIQITLRPRWGIPMTVHAQDRAFSGSPVTGNIHRMVDLRAATRA